MFETDVVVVGSGPGGATVARELARSGTRVLLLERGVDHRGRPWYGTHLGAMAYADRAGLRFTNEGMNVIRPLMVGGATAMYCGCAAPPPEWLKARYGIDLDQEVAATVDELAVAPLPRELLGTASTQLAEAASSLGYPFEPQAKFLRPARAPRFDCNASCMLGCRCGAKWSAAEYVDDAVAAGAVLKTGARVRQILVEDGRAIGVSVSASGRAYDVRASRVVLAAGGLGTPGILRASGVSEAGDGLAMDVTAIVYGLGRVRGNGSDPPMTWSWEHAEQRIMLSTLVDPWLLYPVMAGLANLGHVRHWLRWHRLLGVMVKLRDDVSGGLLAGGKITKRLSIADRRRLAAGIANAREILVAAGADPETVFTSPLRGTHPSATARIGRIVDRNLETEVEGLYVCDASVFPEALGRPTVLTIVALAKRLAAHLHGDRDRLASSTA